MMLNNGASNNADYRNNFLTYAIRLSLARSDSTFVRRQHVIDSYFVGDASGVVKQPQ